MRILLLLAFFSSAYSQVSETSSLYIVSFKKEPLAAKQALFKNKSQADSYRLQLENEQTQFVELLSQHFNREVSAKHHYLSALNGLSLQLNDSELDFVRQQPAVLMVSEQELLRPQTDASASMINAESLWDGSAISPLLGVKGEGIIIGIIDTGINMGHESFSDSPEDAYDFASANPFGINNYKGWCNPAHPNYDVSYVCNNKLIGAWDFVDAISAEDDGPLDNNFHGTSMSGIASGNYITAPNGGFVYSFNGGILDAPAISGLAPHAHLISYDVCDSSSVCPSSAILAAIDQALLDGVDIINLALDGGLDPWNPNSVAMALLNANNVGIIASTAAGNANSQNPETQGRVSNLAPWVVTAANSLHGRTESNDVSVTSPLPVPVFLIDMFSLIADGTSMLANLQGQIIYSKDINNSNADGCMAWNALDFNNAIALLESGNCSDESKVQMAQDAGAVGVIVINIGSEVPLAMVNVVSPTIPALMIGQTDATNLINNMASNSPTPTLVEIIAQARYRVVNALGFVLYHSSLEGPNNAFDISKPDLAAPGTNIFAAIAELGQPAPQYFTGTGTSQSSAVISGALALLKNRFPGWSPSELKSALMLTARSGMKDADGNSMTSDQVGSGLLDISLAANSALAMPENTLNYVAANPASGGMPKNLNTASMRDNFCLSSCSWTRVVSNKSDAATSWNVMVSADVNSQVVVTPVSFSLQPGESQSLTITFNGVSGDMTAHRFAQIELVESNSQASNARMNITVVSNDSIFSNGFE